MLIIVNTPTYSLHGYSFHAFFMGENGHVCVPNEWDGLDEFSPTEFFIADLQKEAQKAYDSKNWNSSDKTFDRITAYCRAAGIAMPKVEYNCPA